MEGPLRNSQSVRQVAFWLAVSLAAPAFAQDPTGEPAPAVRTEADLARAKELFENGQILYDEGHYEDAIVAWEESYRLSGYPDLLFNISSAYEKVGNYKKAIEVLNRYRVFAGADERSTLDRRIKALEERQATQEAAVVTPTIVTPPVGPTVVTPPPEVVPVEANKPKKTVPIVLMSAGIVGLGVGTVTGLQASSAMKGIKSNCVDGESGFLCPADSKSDVDKRVQFGAISGATLIGGGVLLGAGLVSLIVTGAKSSDVWTVSPVVTGEQTGVVVDGRF